MTAPTRLALAVLLAAFNALSAHAQVGDLIWDVGVDGVLSLSNPTDQSIAFDGYTLACEAGCLDEDGWVPLAESALADPAKAIATLGAGSLSFGKLGTPDPTRQLSEANLANQAVLQPGGSWSFGRPFAGTTSQIRDHLCGLEVTAAISGVGSVIKIRIEPLFCIPEPSCAGLAFMAACGLASLGFRRRRSRNLRAAC